jgi:hypothetical protein
MALLSSSSSSPRLPLLLLVLVASLALHSAIVTALECSGVACDICGVGSCTVDDGSTELNCVPQVGNEGLAALPCNFTPSAGTDGFIAADFTSNSFAGISADDFNATALSVLQILLLGRTFYGHTTEERVWRRTKEKTTPAIPHPIRYHVLLTHCPSRVSLFRPPP